MKLYLSDKGILLKHSASYLSPIIFILNQKPAGKNRNQGFKIFSSGITNDFAKKQLPESLPFLFLQYFKGTIESAHQLAYSCGCQTTLDYKAPSRKV